jgi:glutathione synthase/RimK-type ligase-like ATP-grasp enzyme
MSPTASSASSSRAAIALVTYRGLPDLNADDRLAARALEEIGLSADAVCWDDPAVEWRGYRAVVLRSTWDYHHRLAEFLAWIDRMEAEGTQLWNRPDILRWNTDKRYLSRMSHPRLRPPTTEILARGSHADLAALLDARRWDETVIKPAVSADGYATERTCRSQASSDQALLDRMLERGDVVIQPLVPEIRTRGEISMMFFNGVFSHAVSKRPRDGEFRVQERLGGMIARVDPPASLIEDARELLDTHAPGCLYARVDTVATGDRYILMEVELVEPSLYLEHDRASAGAFARAVRKIA